MIPDKSQYPTHRNPGGDINWPRFYEEADRRSIQIRADRTCLLNAPFGDHPKQSLDVYFAASGNRCPVFLFIHGGGFEEGDKYHYGFISEELAKQGIITVVTSYRLAPECPYPAAVRDIESAVSWIYRNIETLGGDPRRIFVGGHSAGGVLTAEVAFKKGWLERHNLPQDAVRGCLPISGPYDVRGVEWISSYAPDLQTQTAASPLLNLECFPAHSVLALGTAGQESGFLPSNQAMLEQLSKLGARVELLILEGMNHDDTVLALADAESKLFQALVQMIGGSEG